MSDADAKEQLFARIADTGGTRLSAQLRFIVEIDQLKTIIRQTPLIDLSRRENDAEHSWHLAIMAMVLADFAAPEVDVLRAIRMLLVHDIVEIDAGDTFLYDATAAADQEAREEKAADRIFGLLPEPDGAELRALWDEFEAHQSADAHFARAMDRLQPFLHNIFTGGVMWQKHGVTENQVRTRMRTIADGSAELHALVEKLIGEAVSRGYLAAGGPVST